MSQTVITRIDRMLLVTLFLIIVASVLASDLEDCQEDCDDVFEDCEEDCEENYCNPTCGGNYTLCYASCVVDYLICHSACSGIDEDGDGVADGNDSIIGDHTDVTLEGFGGLEVSVGAYLSNESEASNVTGVQDVVFTAQGGLVLEFQHDFTDSSITMPDIIISRQVTSRTQGLVVQGVNTDQKTIYIDKYSTNGGLCVKDSEISSINEISRDCDGVNEIYFGKCDEGETIGKYSCSVENGKYKVTGLGYSGASEFNISGFYRGYFTATYMNEGKNHKEGAIMPGENVKLCFETTRPIDIEEHLILLFQPRYGGMSRNEFHMPDVINTYNVHLYP